MSEYDLIPDHVYDTLPQEPGEKFVVLARVAQSNLARLLDQSQSNEFAVELRSQFLSIISSIADALGIEGLPDVHEKLTDYSTYQTFQVYLAGVIARQNLHKQAVPRPLSVELGRVSKARIQQQIDQLRHAVKSSDLEDKKKSAVLSKLDELEKELAKQRLGFGPTMAIAASLMVLVGESTVALANGPAAAETILTLVRLIGEDKQKEEEERLRLMPPPQALPNYTKPQPAPPPASFADEMDDDVPF